MVPYLLNPSQYPKPPYIVRKQGYAISVQANNSQTIGIQQPGNMDGLIGLMIIRDDLGSLASVSFTLSVNQDQVSQNIPAALANPNDNNSSNGYFSVDRPLTGNDSINLIVRNTSGAAVQATAVFIFSANRPR